jgi:hypothetical protein
MHSQVYGTLPRPAISLRDDQRPPVARYLREQIDSLNDTRREAAAEPNLDDVQTLEAEIAAYLGALEAVERNGELPVFIERDRLAATFNAMTADAAADTAWSTADVLAFADVTAAIKATSDRNTARATIATMEAAADAADSPDVRSYWRALAHGARVDLLDDNGLAAPDMDGDVI